MILKVYTDWWARWNPWSAWLWVYITDKDWKPVEKRYKSLWIKTNNQAEYLWALNWIQRAIELWTFKIKNKELAEIKFEIDKALNSWWWKIHFVHIPREKNKEADRLSNIAMDKNDL